MSQFTIIQPNATATVGFDGMLGEFFLHVSSPDGNDIYTSLADSAVKDSFWLAIRLTEHRIVLPAAVYTSLTLGAMGLARALNISNECAAFDVTPTPLQEKLLDMKAMQLLPSSLSQFENLPVLWVLMSDNDDKNADLEAAGQINVGPAMEILLPTMFGEKDSLSGNVTEEDALAILAAQEESWLKFLKD